MYEKGRAVEQDQSEAASWYRRAAEQGDADAQYRLGNQYRLGKGVVQDDSIAAYWYRKAANQHHEAARHALSVLEIDADRAEQN